MKKLLGILSFILFCSIAVESIAQESIVQETTNSNEFVWKEYSTAGKQVDVRSNQGLAGMRYEYDSLITINVLENDEYVGLYYVFIEDGETNYRFLRAIGGETFILFDKEDRPEIPIAPFHYDELKKRMKKKLPEGYREFIPKKLPEKYRKFIPVLIQTELLIQKFVLTGEIRETKEGLRRAEIEIW